MRLQNQLSDISIIDVSPPNPLKHLNCRGKSFMLTSVYGPTDHSLKEAFFNEMQTLVSAAGSPWLILGDFNQIYEARDKNNINLNRCLMGRFRAAHDAAGLFEIRPHNRKFTWSNEQSNPTLVALDQVFCNVAWDALFPKHLLHAASTACSDHCPIVLANAMTLPRRAVFRFEMFWTRFPGFQQTVVDAWSKPVHSSSAFKFLNCKLKRTARALNYGAWIFSAMLVFSFTWRRCSY